MDMKTLIQVFDSYEKADGTKVEQKIGWASCLPVTIKEAREFANALLEIIEHLEKTSEN